ncbi:MAG: NADPH-dependent F420 reductase [Nocardioidaceae bacterium]|nr:NADPH-dependent F420 reductase [Nocardioidaceae bacterium]
MDHSIAARIAILGGTGPQGRGIGYRLARAGYAVVLGSRDQARGTEVAAELAALPGASAGTLCGTTNRAAVQAADVVVVAVPYDGHAALLTELAGDLAGKLVVDCVNPLGFDKLGPFGLAVEAGSAAEEAAALLPDSTVTGAFHHLAAPLLLDPDIDLSHEDVLVCGDDRAAKERVIRLAEAVTGGRGLDAGRLRLARQLEPLTAVLISVNKRYRTRAGVALTGLFDLPQEESA